MWSVSAWKILEHRLPWDMKTLPFLSSLLSHYEVKPIVLHCELPVTISCLINIPRWRGPETVDWTVKPWAKMTFPPLKEVFYLGYFVRPMESWQIQIFTSLREWSRLGNNGIKNPHQPHISQAMGHYLKCEPTWHDLRAQCLLFHWMSFTVTSDSYHKLVHTLLIFTPLGPCDTDLCKRWKMKWMNG